MQPYLRAALSQRVQAFVLMFRVFSPGESFQCVCSGPEYRQWLQCRLGLSRLGSIVWLVTVDPSPANNFCVHLSRSASSPGMMVWGYRRDRQDALKVVSIRLQTTRTSRLMLILSVQAPVHPIAPTWLYQQLTNGPFSRRLKQKECVPAPSPGPHPQ